jgi:ketosteroid isomerase-like protein
MKTGYTIILVLIVLLALTISCQKQVNTFYLDIEKKSVEKTIRDSIGWAKNKDINLLYSIINNNENYVEVDPNDKVVRGFKEFKKAEDFWMSNDFKAIRYEIKDLIINFSKSGDVAWFFCMLDDINEWKGQPANWENTRWTGVLENIDGNWVIMQMHFSFAKG